MGVPLHGLLDGSTRCNSTVFEGSNCVVMPEVCGV